MFTIKQKSEPTCYSYVNVWWRWKGEGKLFCKRYLQLCSLDCILVFTSDRCMTTLEHSAYSLPLRKNIDFPGASRPPEEEFDLLDGHGKSYFKAFEMISQWERIIKSEEWEQYLLWLIQVRTMASTTVCFNAHQSSAAAYFNSQYQVKVMERDIRKQNHRKKLTVVGKEWVDQPVGSCSGMLWHIETRTVLQ